LTIRDGEFVVLVGPSGCGKSTLLRMIAGLETISDGTIAIGGVVVNDLPPSSRDIAMVFQNYALYPHMTVRRNMAFGLLRRRRHASLLRALLSPTARRARSEERKAIETRVTEAAATLGLLPYLDRYPRELSGGQRQRVAVGRAIVRDPKVFLFDEPLSNLDARLRIETRAELRELHRALRATMVYVTHDQEEAMTLGDRMVVMRDGVVQQVGTPLEIYRRPANRFVAGFVGTPPMNFLDGTLERSPGGDRFITAGLRLDLPATVAAERLAGPIALGIRPDRLRVGEAALACPVRHAADVEAVETYGDRADVVVRLGPHRIVARVGPELLPGEGARTTLGFDPADLLAFAAE
jgi:multiple sugar transport system ATP-binding protein